MNELRRSKQFEKNFKKRISPHKKLVLQFEERLALFISGVTDSPINDHALVGVLKGRRSFSITSDIRVIYEEINGLVIFMDIGTHNQVYK